MNLKKIVSGYKYFFFLAILCEGRAVWEYLLSPNIRDFLLGSSIALVFLVLPFPIEAVSVLLEGLMERRRIVGSLLVVLLVDVLVIFFWKDHSRMWAVLNAVFGLLILFAIWRDWLLRDNKERQHAGRIGAEELFEDRDEFEKSWRRRIKISEGVLLLFCALLAFLCWTRSFKILAIVPTLMGALFLMGLLAGPPPMSDEKYERELAKTKVRYERAEARRAKYAARRAQRAERLVERKRVQEPRNPSAVSFSSFVYWFLMLCILGFKDRYRLEKPDLIFCAMPAWYLIQAIYFFIRQAKHPKGPADPSASEPPTSSLAI